MYLLKKIYLNAEAGEAGGAATETPNFDLLEQAFSDSALVDENKLPIDDSIDDSVKDESQDTSSVENTSSDKKNEEKNDVSTDDLTFKLPGEEGYEEAIKTNENAPETLEETTWQAMAEAQGLKIEEDTLDAYMEAVKADKETAIQQAVEQVKNEKYLIEIAQFPETERLYMEHVLNGGTFESFVNPTGMIDQYLELDNYDLLAADLKAQGYNDKMVEAELKLMMGQEIKLNENTTNEEVISLLDHNAEKLRQGLEVRREQLIEEIVNDRKQIKEREEQIRQEKVRQENETFKEELGRTETFFDIPVTKQQKDFIKQKWETGELKKLFAENPKIAVKAAMQHYFGDQALKMLKTMEYDAGMDRFRRKLANVPPKQDGGSSRRGASTTTGGEGPNFDLLQQELGE